MQSCGRPDVTPGRNSAVLVSTCLQLDLPKADDLSCQSLGLRKSLKESVV